MNKAILPRDLDLPQLQVAWNAKLMLGVLQDHLRPLRKTRYDIIDCKVSRFRYRQGIRSIILYQLVLLDKDTGLERTTWATGTTYSNDRANGLCKKLLAAHAWRGIPDALLPFEPVSYLPDLKMLIQVFPQDRYLNKLPSLIAGPPPQLKKFLLDQFGIGKWQMEDCRVEAVRYRPNEGVTLRYAIEAVESSTQKCKKKCFFIKIYRDEGGRKTYELLNRLYLRYASGEGGFSTVKPLAYFGDLRALILEGAPGQSLEDIVLRDNNTHAAILRSATALAAFHQSKISVTAHRSTEGTLSRAKKAARFIQWALPNIKGSVEGLIKKIEQKLQAVPPCPTHLDMKVDHIFIDDQGLTFIDLDSFGLSDPVFDPASLFVRMEMLPNLSSVSKSKINTISQLFLEEYFSRVPSGWRKRFAVNYACAALKVALYYIQHQEADWYEQVQFIVNKARNAFST